MTEICKQLPFPPSYRFSAQFHLQFYPVDNASPIQQDEINSERCKNIQNTDISSRKILPSLVDIILFWQGQDVAVA